MGLWRDALTLCLCVSGVESQGQALTGIASTQCFISRLVTLVHTSGHVLQVQW